MEGVPRLGRILDGLAFAVFLAGAGIYGWSWLALSELGVAPRPPGGTVFATVERVDQLSVLSRTGLVVMAAGGALGLLAAGLAWKRRGRAGASSRPPGERSTPT